jgi:hypothetical protein
LICVAGEQSLLTRTERTLIFERERDKGGGGGGGGDLWWEEWKLAAGVPSTDDVDDVDEDGFSDRATQGTEVDERESPVQTAASSSASSAPVSSSSPSLEEDRGKIGVRRFALGCADLSD